MRLGTSPLAVSETVIGVLTVLGTGVGLARMRPLAWAVVAVVLVLIGVSSIAHVRESMRRRKWQEASEAARLANHLQATATDDGHG